MRRRYSPQGDYHIIVIVVYQLSYWGSLTWSRLTSPDRVPRHTDQGESGREKMEQSPENDQEHATTGYAYHESPQNI